MIKNILNSLQQSFERVFDHLMDTKRYRLRVFNVPLHDSPLNASSSLRLSELYFSASNVNTRRNSSKVGLSNKKKYNLAKSNHLRSFDVNCSNQLDSSSLDSWLNISLPRNITLNAICPRKLL